MTQPVATYEFDRGETISLAIDAPTGDVGLVTAFSAKMKAVPWGQTEPLPTDPVAAEFAVAAYPAAGDEPAGWTLTIAAGVSAGLAPGTYHADAKVTVAGGVIISDPVAIVIRQSVSG